MSAGQAAVLAALTAATLGTGVFLRRAYHELARTTRAAAQPDWLADAVALGLRAARLLGPLRGIAQSIVWWADQPVIIRVRAHPIVAAGHFATRCSGRSGPTSRTRQSAGWPASCSAQASSPAH